MCDGLNVLLIVSGPESGRSQEESASRDFHTEHHAAIRQTDSGINRSHSLCGIPASRHQACMLFWEFGVWLCLSVLLESKTVQLWADVSGGA